MDYVRYYTAVGYLRLRVPFSGYCTVTYPYLLFTPTAVLLILQVRLHLPFTGLPAGSHGYGCILFCGLRSGLHFACGCVCYRCLLPRVAFWFWLRFTHPAHTLRYRYTRVPAQFTARSVLPTRLRLLLVRGYVTCPCTMPYGYTYTVLLLRLRLVPSCAVLRLRSPAVARLYNTGWVGCLPRLLHAVYRTWIAFTCLPRLRWLRLGYRSVYMVLVLPVVAVTTVGYRTRLVTVHHSLPPFLPVRSTWILPLVLRLRLPVVGCYADSTGYRTVTQFCRFTRLLLRFTFYGYTRICSCHYTGFTRLRVPRLPTVTILLHVFALPVTFRTTRHCLCCRLPRCGLRLYNRLPRVSLLLLLHG